MNHFLKSCREFIFVPYLLVIYTIFAGYLYHIRRLFVPYLLVICIIFVCYLYHVCWVFVLCLLGICTMFIGYFLPYLLVICTIFVCYLYHICWLFIPYSLVICTIFYWLFIPYLLVIYSIFVGTREQMYRIPNLLRRSYAENILRLCQKLQIFCLFNSFIVLFCYFYTIILSASYTFLVILYDAQTESDFCSWKIHNLPGNGKLRRSMANPGTCNKVCAVQNAQ